MSEQEQKDLVKENRYLRQELERLQHNLNLLTRDKFGSKSEKITDGPPEQMLFNEIEKEAQDALPAQTELIEGYERKKKGRGAKKPFPAHLPREEVVIDL